MKNPIPFTDLAAQQAILRPALETALKKVLDHGQYIMGPEVGQLEEALGQFCGVEHVITCSNGTQALVMALMALELPKDAVVFVPSFTFVATAEAVVLAGGMPAFVDICPKTYTMDLASLSDAWESVRKKGLRPVGIIPVDLFGHPAPYDCLLPWAEEKGLWVLADAAQSLGATQHSQPVGALAPITTTSFFPAKPLGCYGEGGAIFTHHGALAERLRSIRVHGQGKDKYHTIRLGLNGRLETIQAAILLEKLTIFPEEILRRQALAERYNRAFHHLVTTPMVQPGNTSVWAQYTCALPPHLHRQTLMESLQALGIPTAVYYPLPLHTQPVYQDYPRAAENLVVCEDLCHRVFSLPMGAYVTPTQAEYIIHHAQKLFQK